MKRALALVGFAILLAGCAGSNRPVSDQLSYSVPRNLQTVYLRLQHQAQECLANAPGYAVVSSLNWPMQSATVRIQRKNDTTTVAETTLSAQDNRRTHVVHHVHGAAAWNAKQLEAMRVSVMRDASVCAALPDSGQ